MVDQLAEAAKPLVFLEGKGHDAVGILPAALERDAGLIRGSVLDGRLDGRCNYGTSLQVSPRGTWGTASAFSAKLVYFPP